MSRPNASSAPEDKKLKDDRNIRSHYYERVGFRGVDERKTLDTLLNEDPISAEKCAYFSLKCAVPSDRRLQLWRIILGVSARFPNNRDSVWKWRTKSYNDVKKALQLMQKVVEHRPKAQNLTIIYLLFSKSLKFDLDEQLKESKSQNFMALAESLDGICEDEVETFWIAKQLSDFIGHHSDDLFTELAKMFHKQLTDSNSTCKLHSHMEKIGLNQDIPLHTWFSRGFAGVLHKSALEKIWDKVIGGSMIILVHVAVTLVETSKMSLLGCQTSKEAIRCLISTTEETDDLIAQKAIEVWAQEGCQLLPGGITAERYRKALSSSYSVVSAAAKSQTSSFEGIQMVSVIKVDEN